MKIMNNCYNFILFIKKKLKNLNCNFRNSYKYKNKYFPKTNKELYQYRDNLMNLIFEYNNLLNVNIENMQKYNVLITEQLNNLVNLEILYEKTKYYNNK